MNLSTLKLLVVDDDDVDREKIRRMLDEANLKTTIEETSSVDETVTVLENQIYDCIIIDYRLGKEDGLILLNKIRSGLAESSAVILVTGLGDEEVAAKAMRLGANDYLIKKNLSPIQLLTSILSAVHKSRMEKKIHDLAHYDSLTGLVTRHLLLDRLKQTIETNKRNNKLSALAYLDLDNFKPVNDTYGHEAGDFVLIEISKKLKKTLRASDTIARIGGDEFVLLLADIGSQSEIEELLRRVLLIMQIPISLPNSCFVRVSASIGVYQITNINIDAETVLRRADHTMYQAKNTGRNQIIFFDPEEEKKLDQQVQLINEIKLAVKRNELTLLYQPKIDIVAKKFIGVEALIRWDHPTRGLLIPEHFSFALNDSTVGIRIGEWVIKEALQQCSLWSQEKLSIPISINISTAHIQSGNFILNIQESLIENPNIDPNLLELEVLETVLLKNVKFAEEILTRCKKLGVKIALDDFGTGYSSFSHLKTLPLDIIKIDKTLIQNIETDAANAAIVKSMIDLSKVFNYQLIGKGIESQKQYDKFQSLGGEFIQGFYNAKPMIGSKLSAWLTKHNYLDRK